MRDSYAFQIPRHLPINRKRKPFGYVNELSEADSQHWSLRNNIERALPDSYPGVVVWIGLIAIKEGLKTTTAIRAARPAANQTWRGIRPRARIAATTIMARLASVAPREPVRMMPKNIKPAAPAAVIRHPRFAANIAAATFTATPISKNVAK